MQYCNELSMTIELDTTLAQAEVLFLSFAQFVADVDRRKAEEFSNMSATNAIRRRSVASSSDAQNATANVPDLSENLRELLNNSR